MKISRQHLRKLVTVFLFSSTLSASAQVGFQPVTDASGISCRFIPAEVSTYGGNIGILKSASFNERELKKITQVFDFFKMRFRVDGQFVYVPCEYYSDMSFWFTVSSAYLSEGDAYPRVIE